MRSFQWDTLFVLFLTIALTAWFSSSAQADTCHAPHGFDACYKGEADPALDLPAVQELVDAGGKILLLGTLDFGAEESVFISNNVEIHGKKRGHRYKTTIIGGNAPFLMALPLNFSIHNIHFDSPIFSSVLVVNCSHFKITKSHIVNVQGGFRSAVFVDAPLAAAQTCEVEITNNKIEVGTVGFETSPSIGISVTRLGLANLENDGPQSKVKISGNTISKTASQGLNVHSNLAHVIVEKNKIHMSGQSVIPPDFMASLGMLIGNNPLAHTMGRSDVGSHTVRHNRIHVGEVLDPAGNPADTIGILMGPSQGMNIYDNKIRLEGGTGIVGQWEAIGNKIVGNRISGWGDTGIKMISSITLPFGTFTGTISDNKFFWNNLAHFEANGSQIALLEDSNDNFLALNVFGAMGIDSPAGVFVEGQDNNFTLNLYRGDYPDWASGRGLFLFSADSAGNTVRNPIVKHGIDVDKHWNDESDPPANTLIVNGRVLAGPD